MGLDAADRLGGGPPDSADVIAAQLDGDGVFGDVHGDGMPGMDPAEGDLLPGDHDDAGVAGPALGGERLGGRARGGSAGRLIPACWLIAAHPLAW